MERYGSLWRKCRACVRRATLLLIIMMTAAGTLRTQQIAIGRIEQMPNLPAPYEMRDWKKIARAYDSLVFLSERQGDYLPLHAIVTGTINYPSHPSFRMPTYVGTNSPFQTEAINQIPAVISGGLNGIDKRSEGGADWALMCEEFFNNRFSENVYLNGPAAQSGSDWWYDVMPNIFFYQLAWLYPGTGSFNYQFRTVADQWLRAVIAMGGSAAPWRAASMNYRAWSLSEMKPNAQGVPEPEAAGSIAWLLYQAYGVTHDARYRMGAEWAEEYLNSLASNPSYELQLSYGTYIAARMNAELGTAYDVEKMMRWCFDVGPLRSWGAMVGTWGGYDVSGLIGEVNGTNDYAFAMNTFQQAGALAPVVRYDDRFARAVGKWMLNAANAARLFYHTSLPPENQDGKQWAAVYDTAGSICYEALRQSMNGRSPFATGDAVQGGWAKTNLSLYSSSSAGILGAIIETTNVEKILKLDLLATDHYHAPAYPTFLVYNPYSQQKTIAFNAGPGMSDIYDAVSKTFAAKGVSGAIDLAVPADMACVFVVVPSGAVLRYEGQRTLAGDIVIDYRSARQGANDPPRIKACAAEEYRIVRNNSTHIYCTAEDRNGDPLTYVWKASGGKILGEGGLILWNAPDTLGAYTVTCTVTDGKGGTDTASVTLTVADMLEPDPVIRSVTADPQKIAIGASAALACDAVIATGTPLRYVWSADGGTIDTSGGRARWIAPLAEGDYVVTCSVFNLSGGRAAGSVTILVRDIAAMPVGLLIASYPLDGTGADASGNGNNGAVAGAVPAPDRAGGAGGAMLFNGTSDVITVPNAPMLNFQNAITVNFWMDIGILFSRETYPLSHGNWQNRWKFSISNGKVRWTVKTTDVVKDVDSKTIPASGTWYNVTGLYDGREMELYIDGRLEAFTPQSGKIGLSPAALTIGQALPTDAGYNFSGALDQIRIYDYALRPDAIAALASASTAVVKEPGSGAPSAFAVTQNFPNPFNGTTTIRIALPREEDVTLTIYSILGEKLEELVRGRMGPGQYAVTWNSGARASGVYFYRLRAGSRVETRRMELCK